MSVTITRREERPLHPNAKSALRGALSFHGYDDDDAMLICDSVDDCAWVILPNGRRELRDTMDDIGLFAFVTVTVEG